MTGDDEPDTALCNTDRTYSSARHERRRRGYGFALTTVSTGSRSSPFGTPLSPLRPASAEPAIPANGEVTNEVNGRSRREQANVTNVLNDVPGTAQTLPSRCRANRRRLRTPAAVTAMQRRQCEVIHAR